MSVFEVTRGIGISYLRINRCGATEILEHLNIRKCCKKCAGQYKFGGAYTASDDETFGFDYGLINEYVPGARKTDGCDCAIFHAAFRCSSAHRRK